MSAPYLLRAALSRPEPPDLVGESLGRYQIKRVLGHGGMGVVYEAFDPLLRGTVALKILIEDLDARAKLLKEAQITAGLEHKNIVRVYEVGEQDGIDFFTMKLIDGGSLVTPAPSVRRAAEVARDVARAVGFANSRGILHRDLKPQNILIDAGGEPFVTDFGIAARQGPAAGSTIVVGGTPMYMAPEVWSGDPSAASTAADVWGLGAILYELLAGHAPFQATTVETLERQVAEEAPPPLVGVPRDLVAVCLHCLEKDPARRYATATELASDLDRYLADEEVSVRPRSPVIRALRLATRHPLVAALGALLLFAGAYTVITALLLARAQQTALHAADFAARSAANLTAEHIERLTALVATAALDPRIAPAVKSATNEEATEACAALSTHYTAHPFEGWWLFDRSGIMRGRWPVSLNDNRGKSYAFRDYFQGAKKLAEAQRREVYVSRAFRSESDDSHEVALAVPVYDADGRWIAVLAASLPTGSAFGAVPLEDGGGGDRLTATLIAPRDRERSDSELDHEPIFILHPALGHGKALTAPTGAGSGSTALMHIAPVRGTPFSVLVRFAYDDSLATRLGRIEILIAWMPVAALLALVWSLFRWRRAKAARRGQPAG